MDEPLAVLYVTSAYSLSKRALGRLETAATGAAQGRVIRLEESDQSLIDALDEMRAEGHRRIRVQPLGVPFPESITAWLPGVLADWRMRGDNADIWLELGPDPAANAEALEAFATASLAPEARPIDGVRPSLGKPGWNDPQDFEFHLLVCTGPRCMIHGAASFTHMLKDELRAAGVFDQCLTTRTGCVFPCNRGPVLALYPHGHWYRLPDQAATRRFVREVLVEGGTAPDLRFHTARAVRADGSLQKASTPKETLP